MSFESLSVDIQNLMVVNYQYTAKWFLFILFTFLAILYASYIFPQRRKTTSIISLLYRLVFFSVSWSWIFASPLAFILLDPGASLWALYEIPLTLYLVLGIIFLFGFFLKLFKDGLLGILLFMGIDTGDTEVKETLCKIQNAFGGFRNGR